MKVQVICAIFFVLGGASASPNANFYVDNLLSISLRSQIQMQKLDPAQLQNFNTEFKDKIAFIKVKGTANYTEGSLTGLTNAVRFSECQGPYFHFGMTKVNCTIGFNSLQSHFKGKVKYGKIPAVPVTANGNITTTTMFVEFAKQPGSNVGQLLNMQFYMIGEVQPKFTGLGSALNKQLKFLEDGYRTHVKAELMSVITSRFQYALNMAAAQLPMPA